MAQREGDRTLTNFAGVLYTKFYRKDHGRTYLRVVEQLLQAHVERLRDRGHVHMFTCRLIYGEDRKEGMSRCRITVYGLTTVDNVSYVEFM
jgi:predicted NAD/FAD-dependent oxidoreductase